MEGKTLWAPSRLQIDIPKCLPDANELNPLIDKIGVGIRSLRSLGFLRSHHFDVTA
jgi:hypothetical protein